MNINNFLVKGVNNIYDYDIPIEDNTLILVGENGTGKSTILSMLNCIVSRKWRKILDYNFKLVEIEIDNEKYVFTKKEVKDYTLIERNPRSGSGRVEIIIKKIIRDRNIDIHDLLNDPSEREGFFEYIRVHTPLKVTSKGLERALFSILDQQDLFFDNNVAKLDSVIKKKCNFRIIYLPTYRRIERELSSILPNVDKDFNSSKYSHHLFDDINYQTDLSSNQMELVEFGMGDVKSIIKNALSNLEESFRTGMKKLMGDYLQDIILHKHEDFSLDKSNAIQADSLEKMLLRIDDETLSDKIKEKIKENILSMADAKNRKLSESDLVISYFINKLMSFHNEQSLKEKYIKSLLQVCNQYLVRKKMDYNSVKFELKIFHTDEIGKFISETPIPFEALSSGEKQIISLFSHLYLARKEEFMIIIDEPELSLSVDWQRSFLQDIKSSGNCKGLYSVTHSPFVFDNDLDCYARSISEFMETSI